MTHFSFHLRMSQKQQGVTLIEVLITIVLMAFGLLGVVLMQTISLKSNHESSQRTSANYLAEDIISRIRSAPLANISTYDDGSTHISNPTACTQADECDLLNKISHDLLEWRALLASASNLVNASGCIQITNNQIQVIISWDGIGKSKASSMTSCGTGNSAFKRRSLTIFTLH
jgi:type IV pilus assembly protein PilV